MGLPVLIEIPRGSINGRNRDFQVSTSYVPGSTRVFRNGIAQNGNWREMGANRILMNEAPLAGDAIQVFFKPL